MSNPYVPPRTSAKSSDSEAPSNDPKLARRRWGRRVCGVLVGFVAILVGTALEFAVFATIDLAERILFGLAGLTLMVLAVAAMLGRNWAVYAIAAFAVAWLAFLAVELSFVMAIEEIPRRNAVLAIRVFGGAPAVLILALAACHLAFELAGRRRSAELARPRT